MLNKSLNEVKAEPERNGIYRNGLRSDLEIGCEKELVLSGLNFKRVPVN